MLKHSCVIEQPKLFEVQLEFCIFNLEVGNPIPGLDDAIVAWSTVASGASDVTSQGARVGFHSFSSFFWQ